MSSISLGSCAGFCLGRRRALAAAAGSSESSRVTLAVSGALQSIAPSKTPMRPELTGRTAGGCEPTSPPPDVAATIMASCVTQKITRPVARLATISPTRLSWADKFGMRMIKKVARVTANSRRGPPGRPRIDRGVNRIRMGGWMRSTVCMAIIPLYVITI